MIKTVLDLKRALDAFPDDMPVMGYGLYGEGHAFLNIFRYVGYPEGISIEVEQPSQAEIDAARAITSTYLLIGGDCWAEYCGC